MNVVALDVGEKRIGIACGSTKVGIAFTRDTLSTQKYCSQKDVLEKIIQYAQQEGAEKIIVGHPGALSNNESEQSSQSEYCQIFADELEDLLLKKNINISVELIDESFSTQIAYGQLRDIGISSKQQQGKVDSLAAAAFLQIFLDQNR